MDENTMQEDVKREKRIMWAKRICWTAAILMYFFGLYLISISNSGFYGNWLDIPGVMLCASSRIFITIMAFTVRFNEPIPNDKYSRRIIYRKIWLTNAVIGVVCGIYATIMVGRVPLTLFDNFVADTIYYALVWTGLNYKIHKYTKEMEIDHRLLWIVNALIAVPCLLTALFVTIQLSGPTAIEVRLNYIG